MNRLKTSTKRLMELMQKEAEENRPSIDELIEQMDYKLNKGLALLENTIRFQINLLHISAFTSVNLMRFHVVASGQSIIERKMILQMPASPLFKKGGYHHKFTVDEETGEFVVKNPKPIVYPKPVNFHTF